MSTFSKRTGHRGRTHDDRRGQAALEYMATYGWTILVIVILISALAYFGVLSPSRWAREQCSFGSQLECVDYQITIDAPQYIALFLRNNFGKNITITGAWMLNLTGGPSGSLAAPVTIDAGNASEIRINFPGSTPFVEGTKERARLRIQLRRALSGSAEHNLTGILYATPRTP